MPPPRESETQLELPGLPPPAAPPGIIPRKTLRKLAKPSVAIRVVERQGEALTLVDRRIYNVLLLHARDAEMGQRSMFRIPVAALRRVVTAAHHSASELRLSLARLTSTIVEYRELLIAGDRLEFVPEMRARQVRGKRYAAPLLSEALFDVAERDLIWSYPREVQPFLASPPIFGLIDMEVQQRLRSKYALPLYEQLSLVLRLKQGNFWQASLEEFRSMVGVTFQSANFGEVARAVIRPSLAELEQHAGMVVDFEALRERGARRVVGLRFSVREAA